MKGTDKQKEYFELLIDVIDNPVFVANNWKQGEEWRPGKRHFLGKGGGCPPIDHRIIGTNEVLLELDAPSFAQNSRYAKQIIEVLEAREIPYYAFWSGNKSIHIHIFLELEITNPELLKLIKEAMEKGLNIFALIRIHFATEIVTQSGMNSQLIGHGNVVDLAKLKWNDLGGKANLIRVCGGCNVKSSAGVIKRSWKTYLTEIPASKPKPNQYEDVIYPAKLEQFKLDESFIHDVIKKVLDNTGHIRDYKKIEFKGKHLELPCIQRILEGVSEGQRSASAKMIAIAARLDNLPVDKAKILVEQFIDTCPQIVPFTAEEGHRWVDWVYSQPSPFWNCCHCKDLNLCHQVDCSYHKEKFEKEMSIFDVDNPLAVIKKALDRTIVGEDRLKMQCFLLFNTKDFNPEWCVLIDGPASSGKSHIVKKVLELFGEEQVDYFVYSRLTGTSLNHMPGLAKSWEGCCIFIEEIQGAKNVVEQLRVAISERKLTLLETVEVDGPSGKKEFQVKAKVVEFKNVLFITCNAETFDEGEQLKSRSWILNTDQTKIQTERVIDHWLEEFADKKDLKIPNLEEIRAGIRFLEKPDEIVFPFANELKNIVPDSTVRGRRDVKKFVALIKACAYFNQKKRTWYVNKHKKSVIVADWRDVKLVLDIAGDALISSSQGIGPKDLDYYDKIIKEMNYNCTKGTTFGFEDIQRWCGIGYAGARKLMSNLCEAGFFENINAPPLKAEFIKVPNVSPNHLGDLTEKIKENIAKQDEYIKKWVENTK